MFLLAGAFAQRWRCAMRETSAGRRRGKRVRQSRRYVSTCSVVIREFSQIISAVPQCSPHCLCRIIESLHLCPSAQYLKRVGYCPEEDPLILKLTGREMLNLIGRLRGISGNTLNKEVQYVLHQVGLLRHAKRLTMDFGYVNFVLAPIGLLPCPGGAPKRDLALCFGVEQI